MDIHLTKVLVLAPMRDTRMHLTFLDLSANRPDTSRLCPYLFVKLSMRVQTPLCKCFATFMKPMKPSRLLSISFSDTLVEIREIETHSFLACYAFGGLPKVGGSVVFTPFSSKPAARGGGEAGAALPEANRSWNPVGFRGGRDQPTRPYTGCLRQLGEPNQAV